MTTLKVKVSSKEKTTKELEDKIDDMRKLHWDKEKEAESARRELERRSFEKYEEAERLRLKLVETEQRAQEPDRLRRAHEDLERVYASLQHQYQVTAPGARNTCPHFCFLHLFCSKLIQKWSLFAAEFYKKKP